MWIIFVKFSGEPGSGEHEMFFFNIHKQLWNIRHINMSAASPTYFPDELPIFAIYYDMLKYAAL